MQATVRLYKGLCISPDNTLHFDNKQAQDTWFDTNPNADGVSYDEYELQSWNGSRNFRIAKNAVDLQFANYTYALFMFPRPNGTIERMYCFLDNVQFISDEVTELIVTVDFMQTYLFKMFDGIRRSMVQNQTLTQNDFNDYVAYSNKAVVMGDKYNKLADLKHKVTVSNNDYYIAYIVITCDIEANNNEAFYCFSERNQKFDYYKLVFPIAINVNTNMVSGSVQFIYNNGVYIIDNGQGSLQLFINNYGAYVKDVNVIFDDLLTPSTQSITTVNLTGGGFNERQWTTAGGTPMRILHATDNNLSFWGTSYTVTLPTIPKSIERFPYIKYRIGSDSDEFVINPLDFKDNQSTVQGNDIVINTWTSLANYTTNYEIIFRGNKHRDNTVYFSLRNAEIFPFDIDAWNAYYSSNKQYVNQGLKTEIDTAVANKKVDNVTSAINVGIQSVIGGRTVKSQRQEIHQTKGGTNRKYDLESSTSYGGFNTVGVINGIVGMVGDNIKFGNEIDKAIAMRNIEFNDIASSPSQLQNLVNAMAVKIQRGLWQVQIGYYVANNIDDCKAYHDIFGYEINRMKEITLANIKKHTNYDYIQFRDLVIEMNALRDIEEAVEQILMRGVRFWYNYSTFLNYEIPNNDI